MKLLTKKLIAEYKTIQAMITIYCRDHHQSEKKGSLCSHCAELFSYAVTKLDRCPYGEEKPVCNKCPIHCYKPEPKEEIKKVMRYAGPRMLLPHPVLSVRHLIHARQAVPEKPKPNMSNRYQRMQSMKNESDE
ncbi:nitrous oxide-stimulated promoter family protein [Vibrio albus]|uniref:Nitrous oxide-stimulated promoter family protein n=1 Tax=Vibrio albus TaxID=2200953 RepID=A0A2U3B5W4_9VIBR|nr:nitrous oxide-stimulated promoter family protein [Vibrio albus]PWI32180.1 nitrous oxide-stimulated promoter family protein [Vibrio albus]